MKCGIYNFKNIENGKMYIGQSINLNKRKNDHLSFLRNNQYTTHFQNAWNKYGEKSFTYSVMIECERKDLDFYEDLLIKGYKTNDERFGYNLRPVSSSNKGMVFDRGVFNTGDKYNRLTLIKRVENKRSRASKWLCRCDCGKECIKWPASLKDGRIKSCGCYNAELTSMRNKLPKPRQSKTFHREHASWSAMKRRCYNEKDNRYIDNGARGIIVCAEWQNFDCFIADMGSRPEGLSLGRKDVNKNYDKNNCYWATPKQLCSSRRKRAA